ncbi:MAG TPA: hypothetical protein VMS17_26540 [Gemmataceae bacterium]|nr:hypothetical protein [Gemmataceae bacterium]
MRPPTKAATRRIGVPVGAVLAALALAVVPAVADDKPEFPVGAGLTVEDHARIGASALVLNGFPTGCEVCSEGALVSAGQAVGLWPREVEGPPLVDPDARAAAGAATLFLNGFPGSGEVHTELAYLCAGQDLRFWTFFDPNYVRSIPEWALALVKDKTPIPMDPANVNDPANQELDAYFDMLVYANRTATAALDKAAVREDGLWAKVFEDPAKYRGKVLHFEGRLKRLREYPAQLMAVQAGATKYYEGYLSVDAWQDDPVYVAFTELPPGLQPGETLDVPVAFSGYFYKLFRYTAADTQNTHKDRLAPLLIGRTLTLTGPAAGAEKPKEDTGWPEWLGPLFFGVILVAVALLVSLGYWFRHSDRRVHGRLRAARYGEFIPPPPDRPGEPGA